MHPRSKLTLRLDHVLLAGALAAAGCGTTADTGRLPDVMRLDDSDTNPSSAGGSSDPDSHGHGGASNSGGRPGAGGPLAPQRPQPGRQIASRQGVFANEAPFQATAPSARANDKHPSPVTGADCMSCHGPSGSAPRFAFAGTISRGQSWTWSPSYCDPDGAQGGYGGGYGSGYGSGYGYGDDDDDYGYGDDDDDYGYGYGYGGGYGYGYGSGSGGKGCPQNRSAPAPGAEVRLVGHDGLVFDTVTDPDGNFWFETNTPLQQPAFTGIRDGSFTITGNSNGPACGSCHEAGGGSAPGRIWTWDGPTPTR